MAFAAGWLFIPAQVRSIPLGISDRHSIPSEEIEPRKVYPYSVIPGGVSNGIELATKLREDRTAARHYSDFNVERAVLVYARFDRQSAYASYRVGNRVLWTKKRVHVEPTEIVLTDGVHFARTRCGNRLSETPQTPTARDEPTEEALIYTPPPIQNTLIRFPAELENAPSLGTSAPYRLPSVDTVATLERTVRRPFTIVSVPVSRLSVPPTAGVLPEPAPIVLTVSGGLAIFLLRLRRRR